MFKKHLKKKKTGSGKPQKISEKLYKKMEKVYHKMLREAPNKEVTPEMVKDRMGLDCCAKTVSRAFWDHGVYFRPLYEKPDLSPEDVKERREWAAAHKHRSAAQWNKYLHAVIDNKVFPVYATGKFRAYDAQRKKRGAYRSRRRILTRGYIKPSMSLKQNTGQRSIIVTCAIGAGKVLMWHVTEGRWNGESAAKMYTGPLRRALQRKYPTVKGKFRVLEDNDPSGYKSTKGKDAKAAAGIQELSLPKRSPDLNPLDFSLWAQVNKLMRQQEQSWPKSKRETRAAYAARLRSTAMNLPKEYITKIIGAIAGRCQQLHDAKGNYFAEGGHAAFSS